MAAPTCVLTVNKRFTYRGVNNERYSNTYMFTGGTPADSAAWRVLFDALVLLEKTLYDGATEIVGGYGYNKVPVKGDHAIYSLDLTVPPNTVVPGTFTLGSNIKGPGDSAMWVRWGLDKFNPKGKRVYLRKYFHPAIFLTSAPDVCGATWVTAANAFGLKLRDGTFAPGGTARTVTDKDGTALVGHAASAYTTTRTLKRRGKRTPD